MHRRELEKNACSEVEYSLIKSPSIPLFEKGEVK
jgi:hypothetical protein